MTRICNICEDELPIKSFYKKGDDYFTNCIGCTKEKKRLSKLKPEDIKYSIEHAAHVFKVFSARGFFSEDEVKEYQIVKRDYEAQRGSKLPKINEKIRRKRID